MASGMCKNCSRWSSTDKVWGHCTHIESDYPSADPRTLASINLCTYDGSADLWTRENFGCREWRSLRAALKSLTDQVRTKSPSQARDTSEQSSNGDER